MSVSTEAAAIAGAAGSSGAEMTPLMAFALVGALGVGAQWLAWRLRLPAIVLMLAAGLAVGPVAGLFEPRRDIGPMLGPMVSIAVAIILFEGGLSLDMRRLGDARAGLRRLILRGAPLGWLLSALALHWIAGLDLAASAVFGGIMIVTGPTVIAPMLRQARLARRPAALLQGEAIIGDPIGALAAVLAFEVVLVFHTAATPLAAVVDLALGIAVAGAMGGAAGWALVRMFRSGQVAEFLKVPVLFVAVLAVFALADHVLHESGLLAVTAMGAVIANAELPSYDELRRFKEQATVLLVSGVFILLAAGLDTAALQALDLRAYLFVAATVLLVRPATVLLALLGSQLPWRERLLVALTGPRGIVLVAVAALFGARLGGLGIADGAALAPLAFVLVAVSVVLHGFSLAPLARLLGLAGSERPGALLIGASRWAVALAETLQKAEVPVLISDPNHRRLMRARRAGLSVFSGDILSEAAEHNVALVNFDQVVAATDNDAYNTLVATDLGPEFGRDNVFQTARQDEDRPRHALPATLGGRGLGDNSSAATLEQRMIDGWRLSLTRLSAEFGFEDWRGKRPEAVVLGQLSTQGTLRFLGPEPVRNWPAGSRVLAFGPPEPAAGVKPAADQA